MEYTQTITIICIIFIGISILEFLIIFYWYVKKKFKDEWSDEEIEKLLK